MSPLVSLVELVKECLPFLSDREQGIALWAIEECVCLDKNLQQNKMAASEFYRRMALILLLMDASGVIRELLKILHNADSSVIPEQRQK